MMKFSANETPRSLENRLRRLYPSNKVFSGSGLNLELNDFGDHTFIPSLSLLLVLARFSRSPPSDDAGTEHARTAVVAILVGRRAAVLYLSDRHTARFAPRQSMR
jgi:hypothetical protein